MFFRVVCYLVAAWLMSGSGAESCPELPSVDYSIVVAKEAEGRVQGTYTCMQGYHLEGESTLFCNASEGWSAPTPRCRLGHCPDPMLPNGKFSFEWPVKVRHRIAFRCNEHYILKGSSWSQCQEDHTWVPPFPICKSRDCGPPENPAHGYYEGGDFNSGSTITYHCEDRYRLVGTQEQQCVDGEWNGVPPVCELISEAPKPAPQTVHEKALLAFQESEELCKAVENFMQRLKENGSTMAELKHSLETKKAELEAKILS